MCVSVWVYVCVVWLCVCVWCGVVVCVCVCVCVCVVWCGGVCVFVCVLVTRKMPQFSFGSVVCYCSDALLDVLLLLKKKIILPVSSLVFEILAAKCCLSGIIFTFTAVLKTNKQKVPLLSYTH